MYQKHVEDKIGSKETGLSKSDSDNILSKLLDLNRSIQRDLQKVDQPQASGSSHKNSNQNFDLSGYGKFFD